MPIFALSEVTGWIMLVSFLACLVLTIHAVVPRVARPPECTKLKWWRLFVRAAIEFISIWLWLGLALPVIAWTRLGDDQVVGLAGFLWAFAAVVAAITAVVTSWRIWRGTVSRLYARIHFWGPLILLSLLAVMYLHELACRIEGTTAESAAYNYVSCSSHLMEEPIRLVEYKRERPTGSDPNRCKSYRIIDATGPRGRIKVCRYCKFWWTLGSSLLYPPSNFALDEARKLIKDGNTRKARGKLERVIDYYPDTPAEAEAKKLLQQLKEEDQIEQLQTGPLRPEDAT